jgi:hypothetical protein
MIGGKGSAKNGQLASLFPTTVSTVSGAEGLSQCCGQHTPKVSYKVNKKYRTIIIFVLFSLILN